MQKQQESTMEENAGDATSKEKVLEEAKKAAEEAQFVAVLP